MKHSIDLLKIHHIRWLLPLLFVLAAGLVGALPAAAQGGDSTTLTVIVPALNVRSGPGPAYNPVDFMERGDTATIIGQDANTGWWQVRFADGATGWVTNDLSYVQVTGNISLVQTANKSQVTPVNSPPGILVFQTEAGGAIYAVNPDGTNLRYLTTGMDPALSPDGQTVAFTRWETSQDGALGNVWLINIDGSNERVIHGDLFNPRTPVWSADGTQLIFAMQQGGQVGELQKCSSRRPPRKAYNVSVHREDGDVQFCYTLPPDPYWALRQFDLTTGAYWDLSFVGDHYSVSPAWDPLYSGHVVYNGDFGLMSLDLFDRRIWPLTEDYNDHSPVYSPNGTRIAVSYRQDDHWDIHVMNADGSTPQRLTETSYQTLVQQELRGQQPHSYNNGAPVWSPDGTQIAFVTDRSGAWEIWLMNADGSNQHPLLTAETLAANGITLKYSGVDEQMLSWR